MDGIELLEHWRAREQERLEVTLAKLEYIDSRILALGGVVSQQVITQERIENE